MLADRRREREREIRKLMMNIYNKQREDFPSLLEFNNYLEKVENLIYAFATETATDADRAEHEQYKQENAALIKDRHARLEQQEQKIEAELLQDRREQQERIKRYLAERNEKRQALINAKEAELTKLEEGQDLATINLVVGPSVSPSVEAQRIQQQLAERREQVASMARAPKLPRMITTEEEIAAKKEKRFAGPTILGAALEEVVGCRIIQASMDYLFV